MFCLKKNYHEIERIQKRAFKIVYNSNEISLQDVYSDGNAMSFHDIHKKFLLTEIYKTINDLNPCFMKELFIRKEITHNLRNTNLLKIPMANTVKHGLKTTFYRGAIL